jgi:serine/threonine protein kinase
MGVVYKCFDQTGGIDVALKALPPELSHNSAEMALVREDFQIIEQLHHPNIAAVKTLEQDAQTGDYFLIMECVEGMDL